MDLFLLSADIFEGLLPEGVMGFIVPGAVAAGLFAFIIYKLLKEWGIIDGI